MAESSALNNDQGLSAADYADLQHIGSQLPEGHPIKAKIDRTLSMSQPNAGLAGPAAPGPVEKVAPTAGPIARTLTAGANRIADMQAQGAARDAEFQNRFIHNQPIAGTMLRENATIQNPLNAIVPPSAQERFGKGDIAGGIGETGANLLPLEIARRVSGGEPLAGKATTENMSAPIRGAVKAANSVMKPVAGIGGALMGGLAGHPWLGYAAGRELAGKFQIPGERLGLPEETVSVIDFGKNKGKTLGFGGEGDRSFTGIAPPVSAPRGIIRPIGEPMGVPPRIPSTPRSSPVDVFKPESAQAPEPAKAAAPQISMADQIATAKNLGFKNLHEAISKFGFEGWQKILGQGTTPAVAEPPSVRPGSPTPFGNAPLTPADLAKVRNTTPPTWADIERQYRKEQFYDQAPMTKTKAQLVNEANQVEPSIVAKSEANTSPYNRNLPTKKR